MHGHPAIFLSGTAPNSLGSSLLGGLRKRYSESPIVAFDNQTNPILNELGKARLIELDLNPLNPNNSYERLAHDLHSGILRTQTELGFPGVGIAILAAGVYDSGPLVETSIEARKRLVGGNVCGKIELLNSVLSVNHMLKFNSSKELTIVDVGSLHGLAATGGRSIYAATKAFGLNLCLSLLRGLEVNRLIYLAPGPIDTHMLHRNHWVSKENGSPEFFDYVRTREANLYEDVFIRCDDAAFADVTSSSQMDNIGLAEVFARYKKRRAEQFNDGVGILRATDVADRIVEVLADNKSYSDGVYILTAPSGEMQMKRLSFTEVIRH